MNTSSSATSSGQPLWELTYDLYTSARTRLEKSTPPPAEELAALAAQINQASQELIQALRQPLRGGSNLGDLMVSAAGAPQETGDFLSVGDVRLLGYTFRSPGHRTLAVLVLDERPGTDEWLAVPFGPSLYAVRDGEWETQMNAPLLHVLCFWNARWVKGAVLEDALRIDEVPPDDLARLQALHLAAREGRAWGEADLARSAPPITSVLDGRHEYADREEELMREITLVQAFRLPMGEDAGGLTVSTGGAAAHHRQTYNLVGFARELRMNTLVGGRVEVSLGERLSEHGAALHQPVLATGSGAEYPLVENGTVIVPLEQIEQGFTVRMGELGPATLAAAPC